MKKSSGVAATAQYIAQGEACMHLIGLVTAYVEKLHARIYVSSTKEKSCGVVSTVTNSRSDQAELLSRLMQAVFRHEQGMC